jgi:hypothetical protein
LSDGCAAAVAVNGSGCLTSGFRGCNAPVALWRDDAKDEKDER